MRDEQPPERPDGGSWRAVDSGRSTTVGELLGAGTTAEEPPTRSRSRSADRERLRRRRRRRTLVAVVVAVALVAGAGYLVAGVLRPLFDRSGAAGAGVTDYPGPGHGSAEVVVEPGDTGAAIGEALEEAGVVASAGAFADAYTADPAAASIQPGTYELMLEMKASDAVTALLDTTRRISFKVTVPEGLTAVQTFERISAVTLIPVGDLQAAVAAGGVGLPPEAGGVVEGWLFPATYSFEPGSTATTILTEMVAKTVSVLDGLGVPAGQRQTVLTIASIAEKEVAFAAEYPKVARVIQNRLEREIPLGMDSINAYGLGKSGTELVAADFEVDNPYNSRRYLGLPPTPISNPGEAAIAGALSPAEGDWVYFVTVNLDTGETVFTSSYDEFLAAKARYQQWLEENS